MRLDNKIINITFLIIACMLCWFGTLEYIFPVVKINSIIVCTIILFLLIFITIFYTKGKIKFDLLSLILLIRLLYYCAVYLGAQYSNYILQFFTPFFGFFAYLFSINLKTKNENLLFFIKLILLFTAIQVILDVGNALKLGIPFYMVKSNITTPIGNSNFLTVIWLLFLPFIYTCEKSEFKKNFYLIVIGILILLARSNSGFIVYLLFIGLNIIAKKEKKLKKIIILLIGFFIIFAVMNNYGGYFDRLNNSINRIFSNNSDDVSRTLNGRDELFSANKELFINKPIFGYGLSYREYTPYHLISHNWIYESLLTGGIISLILQVTSLIISIVYIKKSKNYQIKFIMYVILLLILVQGLVEPSLGTSYFDLLFWLIIGCLVNETRKEEKGNNNEYIK